MNLLSTLRPLAAAIAVATAAGLSAQTEASFMHYIVQPSLLNPALVGFEDNHQVRLNYRAAAAGLSGAPTTYALNYTGAVGRVFGVGAQVFADREARLQRTGVRLAYAFHHRAGDFKLAGGFSTSLYNTKLRAEGLDDLVFEQNDPEILSALDGESSFDAALGLHAQHKRGTFIGVSMPTLVSARLDEIEANTDHQHGGPEHFILRVGHEARMPYRNFKVTPSVVMSRLYGAPFRVDFNAVAGFLDDTFVAGLSYRAGAGNDVGIMLGARIKQVRAYYSYDVNFGEFQSYHAGGHEITLGFDFNTRAQRPDAARYD